MLQSVQHGRNICRCVLQSGAPLACGTQIREYQNPYTQVFERLHPVSLVGKGKYPKLKTKHYILKRVMPIPNEYRHSMKCILTREVKGLGLQGEMVQVKRDTFRLRLFATGEAVYASPENIKKYEKYTKIHQELGLSYAAKRMVELVAAIHLPIYLSATNSWTLNKSHVRIAFRRIGIMMTDENITVPATPITKPNTFIIEINLNQMIFTKIRATIYPVDKGEATNPDIDHKTFDNIPVMKDEPVWIVTPTRAPPAQADTATQVDSDSKTDTHDDSTGETTEVCDDSSELPEDPTPPKQSS